MRIAPPYLYGAGVGFGLWLALRGLFPPKLPLQATLARLQHRRIGEQQPVPGPAGVERWGAALAGAMAGSRLALGGREADLRVTGRSLARHAFDKAAAGVATATLPLLAAAAAASGGVSVPLPLVALAAAGGAVAGFAVPDFTLKEEAARRRQEFRFALASYLELVVVVVAAGGGTETALFDAASAGEGWVYDELRSALGPCRLTGEAPWDALAALGRELGVPQLVELAATITLAGEHGAKVRDSLRAKAQSLRHHQQSEVLAEAESATEKMAVPVVELLFAFLLFVAYPAVARIVTGL